MSSAAEVDKDNLSRFNTGVNETQTMDDSKLASPIDTAKKTSKVTSNITSDIDIDSQQYKLHISDEGEYNWEDHKKQFFDPEDLNNPRNTAKTSAKKNVALKLEFQSDDTSNNTLANYRKIDDQARRIAYHKYGYKDNNNIPLEKSFIISLGELLDYDLPSEVVQQLMIAGINQPYKLINTFGGQMTALAHQLSYATPSVFLFLHPLLTKRLIFFSRLVLNIEINTTNISTKQWKKRKKNDKYDTTFFNMKEKERLYYRDSIFDIQFEYQVSALFASLMKVIIDTGNEEIHSITSFHKMGSTYSSNKSYISKISNKSRSTRKKTKSRRNVPDDTSTIRSIPISIDTSERKHNLFVTNRKSKNILPTFDTEKTLKKASKSSKKALINGRRSSGFSKAKSPLDTDYHPDWNLNVQGQQVNLDKQQTFMAGIVQHGTQNRQGAQVHPRFSRVKFHSPQQSVPMNEPSPPQIQDERGDKKDNKNNNDQHLKTQLQTYIDNVQDRSSPVYKRVPLHIGET